MIHHEVSTVIFSFHKRWTLSYHLSLATEHWQEDSRNSPFPTAVCQSGKTFFAEDGPCGQVMRNNHITHLAFVVITRGMELESRKEEYAGNVTPCCPMQIGCSLELFTIAVYSKRHMEHIKPSPIEISGPKCLLEHGSWFYESGLSDKNQPENKRINEVCYGCLNIKKLN